MKKEIVAAAVVIVGLCLLYGATGQTDGPIVMTVEYDGMETCMQQIGFAEQPFNSTNYYPIIAANVTVGNQTEITDEKGYCIFTLNRDQVYEVRTRGEKKRLFVACQEAVVVVRM